MSFGKKFDQRMKSTLGLNAVWPPASAIQVGDVLQKKDGVFKQIGSLAGFGVSFQTVPEKMIGVNFSAQGVHMETTQGGAEVGIDALDLGMEAEAEIHFQQSHSYHFATPGMGGKSIDDLWAVGQKIADQVPDWKHGIYCIAWKVLTANDFAFMGSKQGKKKKKYSGSGSAVVKFVKFGVSAGLTEITQWNIDMEIVGEKGPVAAAYAKVKPNGMIRHVG